MRLHQGVLPGWAAAAGPVQRRAAARRAAGLDRPGADAVGRRGRRREHGRGLRSVRGGAAPGDAPRVQARLGELPRRAHLTAPNLITHVATTDATVTDNQKTRVIHNDPARQNPAPGPSYLDSGY